jgi:hypothetical protein
MAQEPAPVAIEQGNNANQDGTGIYSQRAAETRAPQFVGGDIDTVSGNLIPSSKSQAAAAPPPATPTTRLGSIDATAPPPPAPSSSSPSIGSTLGSLATSVGASLLSKGIGSGVNSLFGGAPSGGSSSGGAGANPLDTTIGGGVNNTGAGGGGSNGSGMFGGPSPSATPATFNTLTDPSATSAPTGAPTGSYDPFSLAPVSSSSSGAGNGSSFSGSPSSSDPSAFSAPAFSTPSDPSSIGGSSFYSGPGDAGGVTMAAGTVICTELHRQGLLDGVTYQADQAFGAWVQHHHPHVYAGYLAWGFPCVALMRRSKRFTAFVRFFAKPWAQHLAYEVGERHLDTRFGAAIHGFGWSVCALIGRARAMIGRYAHAA